MSPINSLYSKLPDQELPPRHVTEYVDYGQNEAFFHLAFAKSARIAALNAYFSRHPLQSVFLSPNLAGFNCAIAGIEVVTLECDSLLDQDPARFSERGSRLDGCVVIVNNNDLSTPVARANYTELFEHCKTTCFIGWDWDNHHWVEMSTFLAAHCDIYCPAHHENLYLLSRYNWITAGPVYGSSVQWPRSFLTGHLPEILAAERSAAPLGMHIPYSKFSFRIQVISTLGQHYPSIGFSAHSFHRRAPGDRLKEWYSHKTHWIAPVLNDVPIRIFDALVTGGIPIVPDSLRFLPPINAIPREFIAFYSPTDVMTPQACVERANRLFDAGGRDGVEARHRLALHKYHGEASVRQMLGYASELLGIPAAWQ